MIAVIINNSLFIICLFFNYFYLIIISNINYENKVLMYERLHLSVDEGDGSCEKWGRHPPKKH